MPDYNPPKDGASRYAGTPRVPTTSSHSPKGERAPESPFIEELKKAGEEIKKAGRTVTPKVGKPSEPLAVEEKEKTGLEELRVEKEIISADWQKEIREEREKLEGAYKEVEELRRKIQQRLERIRRLEVDFARVKNEISHFQQVKKENQAFLEEIKKYFEK